MKLVFMKHNPSLRLYIVLSILFLLSSLYFFVDYRVGLNVYDEGLMVYGATRILHGDIPYRDFRAVYAPAQFYVLAATFKIFGTSIVVERMLAIVMQSFLGVCVYLLAKKLVPQRFALISWVLFVLGTCLSFGILIAYSMTPALIFALLSCLCLTNYVSVSQHGYKGLLLAGILAGMATLFRHDFGFYTFISGIIVVFAFTYKKFEGPEKAKAIKKRIMPALFACLRYAAGTGMILLPVCIFFISSCSTDILITDFILFPLKIYPKVRSVPYPYPKIIAFIQFMKGNIPLRTYVYYMLYVFSSYIPIVILAATTALLITRMRRGNRFTEKEWIVILCLLMGATFFNYARVRPDFWHFLPFQLPAIVLFPWLFQGITQEAENRFHRKHQGIIWKVALLLAMLFVSCPVSSKLHNAIYLIKGRLHPLNLERAHGIYLFTESEALNLERAVNYIKDHVPPGERIFVGNSRHDQIFVNDIMFYFLSDRHSVTRYHHFDPGVQTTRVVQQKMIDEIRERAVNYVVLWLDMPSQEPNESNKSSGVHDLDNFIRQNYEAVAQFGPYLILRRINRP